MNNSELIKIEFFIKIANVRLESSKIFYNIVV
jgi:hypothetical protein